MSNFDFDLMSESESCPQSFRPFCPAVLFEKKEDYLEKQSRWSDIAIVMFL
jgi:predicted NodU family carbamoyl transferase